MLSVSKLVLCNRAQLLLHRGILRQLRLEFLEELRRILLRHLREHLRVRLLLIEFLLDAEFLLLFAQRRARLIRRFPLLHFFKMVRDLVQRIGEFLLLFRSAFEVGLLLRRRARRSVLQCLLGLRRRILQHRERIVRIAHLLALILFQNILLVRVRANEVFQRLDFLVELLLLRDLICRLRLRIVGILLLIIRGAFFGFLFNLRLLLRERGGELAHGRRKLCQFLARLRHRLAEKIQRQLHLPGEQLGMLPHTHRLAIEIPPPAHLPFHRMPRLDLLRLPENLLRACECLRQILSRTRRLRVRKLVGNHPHPCLQPPPVARRIRPRGKIAHLPALTRCELRKTVHRLLQIVPAFQHAEHRVEFAQLLAHLRRLGASRDRTQRFERRHCLPHIGHKLVVRMMADFLKVTGSFEKLARKFPSPVSESRLHVRGKARLLPNHLQRLRKLHHNSADRPCLLRRLAHQRDGAQSELPAPVMESTRRSFDPAIEFTEPLQHPSIWAIIRRQRFCQSFAVPLKLRCERCRVLLRVAAGAGGHRRENFLDHLCLRNGDPEPARHWHPFCSVVARSRRHIHQSLLLTDKNDPVLREDRRLLGERDGFRRRARELHPARDLRA